MKIYLFDLWFIMFIKIFRRGQDEKIRYTKLSDDKIEYVALYLSMFTGCYVLISIFFVLLNVFFDPTNRELNIALSAIIVFSLYFAIYFRYIRGYRWKKIEELIDIKYKRRQRDLFFIFSTLTFFIYYTMFIIIFFGVFVLK